MNKSKKDFINKVFITNNASETRKLGRDFAKSLRVGDTLCLYGDLGSGKTTFVQGLAKGLGIKQKIISPTFIIVRCYELQTPTFAKASAGRQNSKLKTQNYNLQLKSLERFYHIDLYRVEGERDLESLGLEEIINDPQNIIAIEWAEKLKSSKPKKRIDIIFSYEKENTRKVTFSLTT